MTSATKPPDLLGRVPLPRNEHDALGTGLPQRPHTRRAVVGVTGDRHRPHRVESHRVHTGELEQPAVAAGAPASLQPLSQRLGGGVAVVVDAEPGVDGTGDARHAARPANRRRTTRLGQQEPVRHPAGDLERARAGGPDEDSRRLPRQMVQAHRVQMHEAAIDLQRVTGQQPPDRVDGLLERHEPVRRPRADLPHPLLHPMPEPAVNRSGCSLASPAISIAAIAGLRTAAGRSPMPTPIRSVTASAVAAMVRPPARKQSSTTHSSSKPSCSARRANAGSSSGGHSGRNRRPSLIVRLRLQRRRIALEKPAAREVGHHGPAVPQLRRGELDQGVADLPLAPARLVREVPPAFDLALQLGRRLAQLARSRPARRSSTPKRGMTS